MDLQPRPLILDLTRLDGLSQRLIESHYENNYAGAVKRLNAMWSSRAQLAAARLFRESAVMSAHVQLQGAIDEAVPLHRSSLFVGERHGSHCQL